MLRSQWGNREITSQHDKHGETFQKNILTGYRENILNRLDSSIYTIIFVYRFATRKNNEE